jgi:hypothetical protein
MEIYDAYHKEIDVKLNRKKTNEEETKDKENRDNYKKKQEKN